MTVGAVEVIADIGSGIFLRIDDNFIAKPDLFTKLTPWNGFMGGRGEFYRGAACLIRPPRFLGDLTRAPSPEQLRSIVTTRTADHSQIMSSFVVPRLCH